MSLWRNPACSCRLSAWALALVLVSLGVARADIEIDVTMQHERVVQFEPVVAFVTVRNETSQWLVLEEQGGRAVGVFAVLMERGGGNPVDRREGGAVLESNRLAAGESRSFMIDLARHFDIGERGNYTFTVQILWEGVSYRSKRKLFDVVSGLPVTEKTMRHPATDEIRRYRLLYLRRDGQERLFIDVDVPEAHRNYGVYDLGPLVRVSQPVLDVSPEGWVHVMHQTAARTYVRSILDSQEDALWFVDQQNYDETRGWVSGQAGKPAAPDARIGVKPELEKKKFLGIFSRKAKVANPPAGESRTGDAVPAK